MALFIEQFLEIGMEIIIGALIGYIIASFVESIAHEYISDAPEKWFNFYRAYPRLFKSALETYFSHHVIHHMKTYRQDYVTQFSSDDEKARLTQAMEKRGQHGKIIIDSDFAIRLNGSGITNFILPLAIFVPLLYWLLPTGMFVASLATLWFPVGMSHWVHSYLHMPFDEAIAKASPFMGWLLQTKYMKNVRINHYLHHVYGGVSNFNLVLGADIIRGKTRVITADDWQQMNSLRLLDNSHDYVEAANV